MNIAKIADNIYYVGVNDRVTEKFESMWPVPDGISYNSYIVKGEKIALIDTVEIGLIHDFRQNLEEIIGKSEIDYLVVNHMEPDHSGGIPVILDLYPGLKIVGNKQTVDMIKGYYHVTDDNRFHVIADGDTLDLGEGKQLRFVLTPMVHWPETMMTYEENTATLFSGDAFGTFGALNGGIKDSEMETDLYIEESYRYYSNIVAKYNKFVIRALQKLEGIPLQRLCSTHGPVWEKRLDEIIRLTQRLAGREDEKGVTIVYGSMYGMTAEAAELMARELASYGVRRICVHNVAKSPMSYIISDAYRYSGLVVCSSTYSMTLLPGISTFLEAMGVREVGGKKAVALGSFAWAPVAGKKIAEIAGQLGWDLKATVVMKQSLSDQTRREIHEAAAVLAAAL